MTQFLIPPPPGDPTSNDQAEAAPTQQVVYHSEAPVETGTRLVPIIFVLLLLVGIGAWITVRTTSAKEWYDDVYAALDVAEAEQRPVFVLFTADWCPPCRRLKSETLSHPEVAAELEERFVRVKVDLTEQTGDNAMIASSLDVSSIPAMHVYDADGIRLAMRSGYIDPAGAIAWLQDARSQ